MYRISLLFVLLLVIGTGGRAQPNDLSSVKEYYKTQGAGSCMIPFQDTTGNISQIILIRHGEPDINRKGWRNRKEAIRFMEMYDRVNVLPFNLMPVCPDKVSGGKIYHSNIPRAVNTAERIFADRSDMISDARFREFERKVMPFFNIKMPLKVWMIGSRALWFLGANDTGIETYREARKRTKDNAAFLAEQAAQSHLVILVAHGVHNRYVAKYLKRAGWEMVKKGGNGYTSASVLAKRKSIFSAATSM